MQKKTKLQKYRHFSKYSEIRSRYRSVPPIDPMLQKSEQWMLKYDLKCQGPYDTMVKFTDMYYLHLLGKSRFIFEIQNSNHNTNYPKYLLLKCI